MCKLFRQRKQAIAGWLDINTTAARPAPGLRAMVQTMTTPSRNEIHCGTLASSPQRLQHILCRRRRGQLNRTPMLSPRIRHRITQCLVHADRQHEGRLPHGFAAKHVVFAIRLGPQFHLEMLGHVARGGDFVGAGRVRGEHSLVIPHQLLCRQPAHALYKAAFNLADVNGRVDAAAHVVQDVYFQHAALAR